MSDVQIHLAVVESPKRTTEKAFPRRSQAAEWAIGRLVEFGFIDAEDNLDWQAALDGDLLKWAAADANGSARIHQVDISDAVELVYSDDSEIEPV